MIKTLKVFVVLTITTVALTTLWFGSSRSIALTNFADATGQVFQECTNSGSAMNNSDFCKSTGGRDSFNIVGPDGLITNIVRIVAWFVGILSVIMILFGGFRYIVSGGDSAGVNNAKNTIIYAVVGLLISISSQLIAGFVLNNL